MNREEVKIEDNFKSTFIYTTILLLIVLLLPLIAYIIGIIFFQMIDIRIFVFLQIFLLVFIIPILIKHLRNNHPPYIVTFLAFENKFEFRIYNRTYKEYLWSDIKEIIFVNERINLLTSGKNDLKMKINHGNVNEELRIYLMRFRESNFEEIKKVIKNYARSHNVIVLEPIEYEVFEQEDRMRELHEVQSFIKNFKGHS